MDNTRLLYPPKKTVSIAEARKILEQSGKRYTDEEIQQILDYLYALVEIQHEELLRKEGLYVEDRPKEEISDARKAIINN